MSQSELPPDFAPRLMCYGIDDRTRALLSEVWELLEPQLDSVMEDMLCRTAHLKHVAAIYAERGDLIVAVEKDHARQLMTGGFSVAYFESCGRTAQSHTAVGLEARGRMLLSSMMMARGFALLAGRHRFAGAALAERASALMRAMMCDVATVSTLALRAKEQIAEARRREVDAAIGEFDGAIGAVIEAINESSGSLADTSAMMQQIADDTVGRMGLASAASEETTESVDRVVTATSDLAASIQEIGQQAARSLDMARAAVADTERTNHTIRSLDEAAEKIGSVVGLISKIAAQTNLLALNATI